LFFVQFGDVGELYAVLEHLLQFHGADHCALGLYALAVGQEEGEGEGVPFGKDLFGLHEEAACAQVMGEAEEVVLPEVAHDLGFYKDAEGLPRGDVHETGDLIEEAALVYGARDDVVCAARGAAVYVGPPLGGDYEYGDGAETGVRADGARELVARHIGEVQVGKDEVHDLFLVDLEGLAPALCGEYLELPPVKEGLLLGKEGLEVVGDEYFPYSPHGWILSKTGASMLI